MKCVLCGNDDYGCDIRNGWHYCELPMIGKPNLDTGTLQVWDEQHTPPGFVTYRWRWHPDNVQTPDSRDYGCTA